MSQSDQTAAAGPLATQVGGTHYKKMAIQPVEFALVNGLNTSQANIIKYACRHADKDGARDLEKAIHYCDLWLDIYRARGLPWVGIGIEWPWEAGLSPAQAITADEFIEVNRLPNAVAHVVKLICVAPTASRVKTARAVLVGLLHKHYGKVA